MAALTHDFTEQMPKPGDEERKRLIEYYEKLAKFCDESYEEACGLQKEVTEIKEIQNTLDYLAGLQWKEALPSYRAKPVSNELLSNFWETIGLLTDIKPIFHIKEIGLEGTYSKTASVQNSLVKGWARQSRFNQKMAFWTIFAMMTTAPAKLTWNPFARGDSGTPDDADITFEPLKTTSLLRLGLGSNYQEDEMVIHREWRTLNWICRRYPRMGGLVNPEMDSANYTTDMQAPPTVMPQLFEQLSTAGKRLVGATESRSKKSVYPRAMVKEFWLKDDSINGESKRVWVGPEKSPFGYWVYPKERLYPRGRIIVRANSVTLYDEPNPYFHRKKPFVPLALYAVPWQDYALSVITPWTKQQDILNQILAGMLNMIKKALNPALMAPKSAIHPEALRQIDSGKPNLKISFNSNAATAPVWQAPPNVPGYVLQVSDRVTNSMRRMSAGDAMDAAASKKQIPGADTLDRLSLGKTTPIRQMGGNVETSVDEIGEMWVSDSLQFYGPDRRIELLGLQGLTKADMDDKPGTMIPDGTAPEAYVRKFHFECEKGSLLTIQRQDKIQVSFALRKNHDLSRKKLFAQLDWNINEAENDAELAEEAQQMAQAMAATGGKLGGHKK